MVSGRGGIIMPSSEHYFKEKLGVSHGKAQGILFKSLLYSFVVETKKDRCIRCGKLIEKREDLSIDHIEPWIHSDNPKKKYYSVGNVGYSHKKCNKPHLTKEDVFKDLDNYKERWYNIIVSKIKKESKK
jgi:hypothetical protein